MSNVIWIIPGYVPDTVTFDGELMASYERIIRAFGLSSEVLKEFSQSCEKASIHIEKILRDPDPEGERKVSKKNNEPWSRDYKKQNQHLFKKKKR